METQKFTCQFCGGKIKVDADMGGDNIKCPHCSNMIMVPMLGINPGMEIAEYSTIKKLGMGSMGEVWLAKDTLRNRNVALKILSPALTRDPMFVKRFQREVAMAAKMSHPHIVTAFDAGVDNNIYYLATNYVEGENLEQVLRSQGYLFEHEALNIALAIARALKYAQDRHSIVHRDIKPGNIMLDKRGMPLLMDLGVSKQTLPQDANLTAVGQFVGTPHYMSPEQARAEVVIDFSSDIYSLGCTIYHMLAGRPPFNASSNVEIMNKHIHEKPRPVQYFNPKVSNSCEALLEVMLAKSPSERPNSWGDVILDLEAVIRGELPHTPCPLDSRFRDMQQLGAERQSHYQSRREQRSHSGETGETDNYYEQKFVYFLAGVIFSIVLLICIWLIARFG